MICVVCKEDKPDAAFPPPGSTTRRRGRCTKCATRQKNEWNQRNRDRYLAGKRRAQLKTLYGITPEQFEEMIEAQGGRCGICGTDDPAGRWGTWHVDHNHETGENRGVLCFQCNRRLGEKENSEWHALADVYLKRFER
jgi:hypothetical protein